MDFIIGGNYYKLSDNNIRSVIFYINPELIKNYETASYTAIGKIPTNTANAPQNSFIEYIEDNLKDCIDTIFPETSTLEDDGAILEILDNEGIDNEIKSKYLSKQSNKIDLNDVVPSFWDTVIAFNVVKPTWIAIEKYFANKKDEDFAIIVNFISKNCEELSQQKIAGDNDGKLFIKLLGSNLLPIETYKQVRKSFSRQFVSYDLSNLDSDRIEILVNTRGVTFNNKYYELINTKFPELIITFILQNKSDFLSNINSYPLDSSAAKSLLSSNNLSLSEKLTIIQSLPSTMFEGNTNTPTAIRVILNSLSNSINATLNKSSKIPVNNDFILGILASATDQEQKLKLFVRKCIESTYDRLFVKSGLELLGTDYALIAEQKGHKRNFSLTKENKQLAEYLERNGFISKQYEDKGMLRMNAKKVL